MRNQRSLLDTANYENGYNPLIHWAKGIGYRPNSFKYAERNCHSNLGEEFLINSYTLRSDIENHGSLEQYSSDADLTMLSMMEKRDYGSSNKMILPNSIPLALGLGESIVRRRSVRTYTGDEVTLQHLATVLRAASGMTSQAHVRSNHGGSIPITLRTVASAGGLYPVNIYVIPLNVHKLNKGIYDYSVNDDVLYQLFNEKTVDLLLKTYAISDEELSLSRADYILLLIGNAWKSMRKYGNKGLRFLFHEIGSVTQNIHLASVALGLGSTDCAAYYENEVNELLGMDGINRSVLHTVITGIFE